MSTKQQQQKTTIGQNDELGRHLFTAAAEVVRNRDLRDAMDEELSGWRNSLIAAIPLMREILPPDEKSLMVGSADGLTMYRLTIQRTGGQGRISKVKLLELGISPDIIQAATEKSQEGETVVVVMTAAVTAKV